MTKENKEELKLITELVGIAKSLVKRIQEQWAAMASLMAILVTILILTSMNAKDKDGNEYNLLLMAVGFFTIILLLGKDRTTKTEALSAPDKDPNSTDPEIAFHVFFHALEAESLQYKILQALSNKEALSLPELSQELQYNTAMVRKSADRMAAKGFLETLPGEKPKHISYKTAYKLPKKC
ncbi:MAG: hypothetical protein MK132_02255 [Lentisphaerales bacterium]|nr:hypothetical protein [Lentisphaerales bacterium]